MSLDRLIRCLDEAVSIAVDEESASLAVVDVLALAAGVELLEPAHLQASEEHYARHLVHRDPAGRFSVVAMVWAPGQGTPVHDHGGLWGAEVVLQGAIRTRTHMVVPRFDRADRFHVAVQSEGMATVGEAEPIVPPFDHHTIDNPTDKVAITLHVYGGDLTRCTVYVPTEDGWREDVLALDVDHAPVRRAA